MRTASLCCAALAAALLIAQVGSAQVRPMDLSAPAGWDRPAWAGSPVVKPAAGGGFTLTQPEGRAWAAAVRSISVDLERLPILAIYVSGLTAGASWVLKTDNKPYDAAHPIDIVPTPPGGDTPGRYLVDLRELGVWAGHQTIDIRLFVVGPPGAKVTFGSVALVPAADDARRAGSRRERSVHMPLGAWTVTCVPDEGRVLIERPGAPGGVSVSLAPGEEVVATRTGSAGAERFVEIKSRSNWAEYAARVDVRDRPRPLLHWTVDAVWTKPHPVAQLTPECAYVPAESRMVAARPDTLRVLSGHRFGQAGYETGQAFLPCDPAIGGSALYVQDLTALNPLFEAERASAKETVKAGPDGFGFVLPSNATRDLPAGTHLRLADSWLALSTDLAAEPVARCEVYLDLLSSIYDRLERPATVYTDWADVAGKTLDSLLTPACAANPERGHLRNYVNEPWGADSAEIMVQLDPLVAALLYDRRFGQQTPLVAKIAATLPEFYLPSIHAVRDYNRQARVTKADAWYMVYPLVQLARAAEMGVEPARNLLADSLDSVISLAHACRYDFPVFYNPETLDSFEYSERDCGGAYAYLMLQANDLFHEARCVEEARAALAAMRKHGLDLAYELHLSALSAAACARMWKLTGDESYLSLSLVPIASLMRRCWLWDCRYGIHRNDHLFFGLSAMPGAYLAPFEQYQAWLALREYDLLAHDKLPESVRNLVSEFIRFTPTVLRYTYPPFLEPSAVVAMNDRGHPNNRSLFIPVEDVYDGWTAAGKIGQEIYGSGAAIALAAESSIRMVAAGITIYSEYPLRSARWDPATHSLTLKLLGVPDHRSLVALKYDRVAGWPGSAELRIGISPLAAASDRQGQPGLLLFRVPGQSEIVVSSAK